VAISDPGHLSCVANDYGYEQVFALPARARPRRRRAAAISTSGTSRNVVAAARAANELQMRVIALAGRGGTPLAELADIAVVTPAAATPTACRSCTSRSSTS